MIQRKPLQQLRDGGNLRHPRSPPLTREDATLQENQEPEVSGEQPNNRPRDAPYSWWEGNSGRNERFTAPRWQESIRNNLLRTPFLYKRPLTDSEREPSDLDLQDTDVEDPDWEQRVEQAQLLATT